MSEPGNGFRQHGIGDCLAVGDDAVEVKNQRAHCFNSCKDLGFAHLTCGRQEGTRAAEIVEHFPLRCVSAGAQKCPGSRSPGILSSSALARACRKAVNAVIAQPCHCG